MSSTDSQECDEHLQYVFLPFITFALEKQIQIHKVTKAVTVQSEIEPDSICSLQDDKTNLSISSKGTAQCPCCLGSDLPFSSELLLTHLPTHPLNPPGHLDAGLPQSLLGLPLVFPEPTPNSRFLP